MNEDKPAARTDITEQPPSLVEKVGTHPLGGRKRCLPCAMRGTASTRGWCAPHRTAPHACVAKRNVEEHAALHGATPRRTLRTLSTTH